MEWELVKPWINRLGIVLEFLSFWLAAPEILGEERLRGLERRLEEGLRMLPKVARVAVVVLAVGVAAIVVAKWDTLVALVGMLSPAKLVAVMASASLAMVVVLATIRRVYASWLVEPPGKDAAWMDAWIASLEAFMIASAGVAVMMVVAAGLALARGALGDWVAVMVVEVLGLAVAEMGIMGAFELHRRVVWPLLRLLADDKRIRQRSLAVGAVLFVVGFLLQLIATF